MSAVATAGARVGYQASGACRLVGTATVTVIAVGSCAITATATAAGQRAATTSVSIPVSRAHPVIHFGDRQVAFFRPFSVPLKATSTPPIPLKYKVIVGAPGSRNDAYCTVPNGALTLPSTPVFALAADCVVEVSAAASSSNYAAPVPVRGVVDIGFAEFRVHAADQAAHWSTLTAGQFQVVIHEDSGDAFGMVVGSSDPSCTVTGVTPAKPSPAGTTQYVASLTLAAPNAGSYTCALTADTDPSDYDGGISHASFTLTVSQ